MRGNFRAFRITRVDGWHAGGFFWYVVGVLLLFLLIWAVIELFSRR